MKDNPLVLTVADCLTAGFLAFGSKSGHLADEVLNGLG
jgi:hypothetical protein